MESHLAITEWDILVIDSDYRDKILLRALQGDMTDRLVVFDDSQGFSFDSVMEKFPNYTTIHFYGYAPGVYYPHRTSLVFKDFKFKYK